MSFLGGFLLGILFSYLLFIFVKNLKQKSGVKYNDYKKMPWLTKLKDVLRHMVYEYDVKRKNHDFLLNILYKKNIVMQILHRAHFPHLSKNAPNINFGLALYIPISKLSEFHKNKLAEALIEESDNYQYENDPFDYYVIDLGKGIKHGGYLISRILKEVFQFDLTPSDFDFELFDEGQLPYIDGKHGGVIVSRN